MDTSDRQFIEKRLEKITKYLSELDEVFKFSEQEIKKDFIKLHTLERLIQLIVDEIIDVNTYLIKVHNFPTPDDFQGSFLILAQNNIFPEEFAKKIAPIVGLRNRLVHRYEEVDPELLISTAKREKDDFREYLKFIYKFIK